MKRFSKGVLAALFACALVLCPTRAWAVDDVIDFDLRDGVHAADYQSTLRIEKVDSLDGAVIADPATFAIYVASDMSEPIATFDTKGGVAEFKRWIVEDEVGLNVDTEYVLVETQAPAGYEKAADTHFMLETIPVDEAKKIFSTEITIISGEDAEKVDADGIRIKDDRTEEWDTVYVERHRTETIDRETTKPSSKSGRKNGKGWLAQTGDDTPQLIMLAAATAGVTALAASLTVRRHSSR